MPLGRRRENAMDELLIAEVSKHPSLFDPRNKYYNDSTRRKNVWKTVSKAVDLSG